MGGLELQEELTKREDRRPIIFLTAHGTVQLTVRALKNGAFDFLEKPADGGALLSLVDKALQRDANERRKVMDLELAKQRCDALTERERDILRLVISGNSNKDIAHQLGISHRTVELHRMRVMQKTGAQNVIELVEIARAAGFSINHAINGDSPTPDTR